MLFGIRFFPESASTISSGVDYLYFALLAISLFFTSVIFLSAFYFAIRYRRRGPDHRAQQIQGSLPLEIFWTAIPFVIVMGIFLWSAKLFFKNAESPPGAMEIYVVGKQWMWKLQHPEGRREINELHIPVNQPVRLVMTSEDAIHSFYLPEFRIKQDVLPGRYTSEWFEAIKPGTYHLFCAEYCGTNHSRMIGSIYVMEQLAYESWLSGGATGESMAVAGERLFDQLGCSGCHRQDERGRCPSLVGVFGSTVPLTTGQKVLADEAYVRESILYPQAKVVFGYQPIMPTFEGQVTEEGLLQLIAYVKSLRRESRSGVTNEHTTRRTGH